MSHYGKAHEDVNNLCILCKVWMAVLWIRQGPTHRVEKIKGNIEQDPHSSQYTKWGNSFIKEVYIDTIKIVA